ncbi:sensor histidine kinase [Rubrimonas cliftonensis]|uniref:histidine kinase n=1 Tax=Rubrimonas cliftonensis TaxID=89524 RepID=A0A1H4E2I5_9RHOB|nr:PAS domain-containing sensor histidine kinase [Rubrimonas cliftonensis]SEA79233.1 Signal transduction histidine kinase [Rubrimonas cliftonensis]
MRYASPGARGLLGPAARRGASAAELRDCLRAASIDLARDFDNLLTRGAAFRRTNTLPGAGVFAVSGAPIGGGCTLKLHDVSCEAAELALVEREMRQSRSEAALLRRAVDALEAPVWRVDDAGGVVWSNEAAGASGVPGPNDAVAARVAGADSGGALVMGRPSSGATGAEVVLERFVATVTETFAHLRVGMAIYDSERRLTLANPALADMFGMDPAWLSGRPSLRDMLDRLREARMLPEQLDYPAWRARLFTLFDGGETPAYDERWELPDQRIIHVLGKPHPLGGIAFVFEDVSAATEMERWRRTAMKSRRVMLDAMLDGVVEFSPDGTTRMANPAFLALWGLDVGEAGAPRHVRDFAAACRDLAPEPPIWDIVRDAVSNLPQAAPGSHRVRLKDGRVLVTRIAKMPDGKTLAAFSDVTDSARVAEALRERAASLEAADAMRTAMLYQISHRLRTPLNAVLCFTDLLAADTPRAAREEFLETIRDAAASLLEGVESLSELVATGSPSVEAQSHAVMVAPVLRGAAGVLERRLRETGARVDLSDIGLTVTARGDPARVRQMIFAMLSEAVRAAGRGDVLKVGVEARRPDEIELWCSTPDHGETATPSQGFEIARRTAEIHGASLSIANGEDGGVRVLCRMAGAL